MRSIMGYVTVAVAMVFVGSVPASAKWNCQGPAYACNDRTTAASGQSYTASKKKTATTKSKSTKTYAAAKTVKATGAYSGKASYYWQPQRVASGGWFNPNAMTAAHKTLPFGTKVRVTNRNNGKSVVVTINDRGPYVAGRVIDLSRAAAYSISMQGSGVVPVSVAVLGRG